VRNDCFFRSIPLVLKDKPATIFICLGMTGNSVAEKWVAEYGIEKNIRLLPSVSRSQMAELFKLADISVSPSTHDGTPNTLLEAIALRVLSCSGRHRICARMDRRQGERLAV
jgi:glycosyltransferase involved in cell wall biosynthesis